MQQAYTDSFNKVDSSERYKRKLSPFIEAFREKEEIECLTPYMQGTILDCTIATGRFIGKFNNVLLYDGMDYSASFLKTTKTDHPKQRIFRADLSQTLPVKNNHYDTVLCLRTLSALGTAHHTIPEMTRICKPGGYVIFDYGRKPSHANSNKETITVDGENIQEIVSKLPLKPINTHKLDSIYTRIKRNDRVFKVLKHRYFRWIPNICYQTLEKITVPLLYERSLYVFQKQ